MEASWIHLPRTSCPTPLRGFKKPRAVLDGLSCPIHMAAQVGIAQSRLPPASFRASNPRQCAQGYPCHGLGALRSNRHLAYLRWCWSPPAVAESYEVGMLLDTDLLRTAGRPHEVQVDDTVHGRSRVTKRLRITEL